MLFEIFIQIVKTAETELQMLLHLVRVSYITRLLHLKH